MMHTPTIWRQRTACRVVRCPTAITWDFLGKEGGREGEEGQGEDGEYAVMEEEDEGNIGHHLLHFGKPVTYSECETKYGVEWDVIAAMMDLSSPAAPTAKYPNGSNCDAASSGSNNDYILATMRINEMTTITAGNDERRGGWVALSSEPPALGTGGSVSAAETKENACLMRDQVMAPDEDGGWVNDDYEVSRGGSVEIATKASLACSIDRVRELEIWLRLQEESHESLTAWMLDQQHQPQKYQRVQLAKHYETIPAQRARIDDQAECTADTGLQHEEVMLIATRSVEALRQREGGLVMNIKANAGCEFSPTKGQQISMFILPPPISHS